MPRFYAASETVQPGAGRLIRYSRAGDRPAREIAEPRKLASNCTSTVPVGPWRCSMMISALRLHTIHVRLPVRVFRRAGRGFRLFCK